MSELILIVEDDPDILQICRRALQIARYEVLTAEGPTEALTMLDEQTRAVDLLITDCDLGPMNGKDLAVQIARACPRIRVLFISGAGRGMLEPEDSFLPKPFGPSQLVREVRGLLKERADQA